MRPSQARCPPAPARPREPRPLLRVPFAAAALSLALALGVGCTTPPESAPEAGGTAAVPDDVLEPLRAMGKLLRSATTMKFTTRSLMDETLESGQLVQVGRRIEYAVRRPDGLYVGIQGDDAHWQLWYDGKKLTVLDRATDDFALADVPPTLDELFDVTFKEHGLTIPMSDILYSDADGGLLENVQAARHLGIHPVDGADCHHLGFRQETIDWQLWVDAGDEALPRKLVITYKLEPGMPQYGAVLGDWEIGGDLAETEFMARVPQDKPAMSMQAFLGYDEEVANDDDE